MKRGRIITLIVLGGAVIGGLWYAIDRINYAYRQRWHGPIPGMQALPPVDRTTWPKPPLPWTTDVREIETATPEGMKKISVNYHVNSLGLKFVRVEPGTFVMGLSDELWRIVGPLKPIGGPMYTPHQVTLTRPFFIAAYETTNKDYEQFDPGHVRRRPDYQQGPAGDDQPVQPITWRDAQRYCRWLSQQEGRLYRLPTEAEWEYACRAGTTNRTYWGETVEDRTKANVGGNRDNARHLQWADDGYEYTAPVGHYPPNPWGLYDMIGNAREWVADWYAPFSSAPVTNPVGPVTGQCRANKSDGWMAPLNRVCSAYRDGDAPHDAKDIHGFRIVCEVE